MPNQFIQQLNQEEAYDQWVMENVDRMPRQGIINVALGYGIQPAGRPSLEIIADIKAFITG